ncbi:MAG: (2Fe-2S)-binding protein [Gammaproteobacteria bacterium]|nr:(2Fe-2S)-binding protein [Gammaproteobacteria bacterium]MCP5198575.1 (2Fe-2S)-binding protein [Gammaproteobacteria bacterium]
MTFTLAINGREYLVESEPEVPLLWILRDVLGLTGTKFGCGVAACGACTVHVDGRAMRTCTLPVAAVADKTITTIEGLDDAVGTALRAAWLSHQVPQCGYCQSGMLMSAAALLATQPRPSDAEIDRTLTNICRCGTYQRIRRAIHAAAATLGGAA